MSERESICSLLKEIGEAFPNTASLSQLKALLHRTTVERINSPQTDIMNTASNNADYIDQNPENAASHSVATNANNISADICVNTGDITGIANQTEENLDNIIRQLEQRRQILLLQDEIRRLELGQNQAPQPHRLDIAAPALRQPLPDAPVLLPDVKFMDRIIPEFSGEDTYLIGKWIADIEDYTGGLADADHISMQYAVRALTGSAKIVYRMSRARNWDNLKEVLMREFGNRASNLDVYARLKSRTRKPDETTQRFVVCMQEIAMCGEISENDLLQIIVQGLNDSSPAIAIMYAARSIAELKDAISRYDNARSHTVQQPRPTTIPFYRQLPTPPIKNSETKLLESTSQTRCFNCRMIGHSALNCRRPKRDPNACFRCFKLGHTYRECPLSKPSASYKPNTTAAVNESHSDQQEDSIGSQIEVRVIFRKGNELLLSRSLFSLLDTGSPACFIRKSCIPKCLQTNNLHKTRFTGLNKSPIYQYSKIICELQIKKKIKLIELMVVPDNTLGVDLLLGQDALSEFNIALFFKRSDNEIICKDNNNIINLVVSFNDESKSDSTNTSEPKFIKTTQPVGRLENPKYFSQIENIDNVMKFRAPLDICDDSFVEFTKESEHSVHFCESQNTSIINIGIPDENNYLKTLIEREYTIKHKTDNPDIDFEMNISLTTDKLIHYAPRRLSYAEKTVVQEMINELLKNNIIRPSNSPYASPIVLVRRKGKNRMCIDYRSLNKITERDNYPLPLIDDCLLDHLHNKSYFSLLDLKSGFHQVNMNPKSIKYTAFVTPFGQYEYLKMPFGLRNAPSCFQRYINLVFKDLLTSHKIIVYMDDILIASENFNDHISTLKSVLNRLSSNNLELNLSKSKFVHTQVDFLGYSVNKYGILPNSDHKNAIMMYPLPKSVHDVRSFIGLCSYFRKFVPSFASIIKPLTNLTRKDEKFIFDSECTIAFENLKTRLINTPVLAIYAPGAETELHTDASKKGFGAVLLQRQSDNKLHPVAYFSKQTKPAEQNYHSFELETLAVIYALKRFRIYLEGQRFTIVTDCEAFTQTLARKVLNPRIGRWVIELENYDYIVQHRSGSKMMHVDALSRSPVECNVNSVQENEIELQLFATQSRDQKIRDIKTRLETENVDPYQLNNSVLYRLNSSGNPCFCVPAEMEQNIIRHLHEKIGHQGIDKCCETIKKHYWFPSIRSKVEVFIKNCIKCIMYSPKNTQNEKNLFCIEKKPVPFHTIHIDHFGPLPSLKSKRKHVLLVVDAFTKYTKSFSVNSTSTKEVIAALSKYFEYYSRPHRIISDKGTCFTSFEFAEFLEKNNIVHVKNATSSPQANGQVERMNRTLCAMLGKLTEPIDHSDWVTRLKQTDYAFNNTVNRSTGFTPSNLLFGADQKGVVIDELTEFLDEKSIGKRNLEEVRKIAKENIIKSQRSNEKYFLKRNKPARKFDMGDYVVIRNNDNSSGNKKLIPKYKGPYEVVKILPNDRYVLKDTENCQITQIPYDGVIESRHMKLWVSNPDKQTDVLVQDFYDEEETSEEEHIT